jgi:hypothetical protein
MHSMNYSRLLAPVICALLAPTLSVAQKSASFNILTSNAEPDNPGNIYAVDVNNDGLTDIVEDNGYSPGSYFYVNINKGNGTFASPVAYALPAGYSPVCIAPGDYNNDGKVDLAVPLNGTDQIAVYLGNGNGTFQSPILSTVNLPNGDTFNDAGCAAADFNADGDTDFAAWGNAEFYVFQGEGNGSFNASAYPVPVSSQNWPQLFVGDYNGDGKADIAVNVPGYGGNASTIYVLYGNNDFTFNQTTPYTFDGDMIIGSGDLNGDGITDLYAIANESNGTVQLGVFYGTNSETFNSYWIDAPTGYRLGGGPAAPPLQAVLTIGDYNGDGRMDLAALASNTSTDEDDVLFFLAGANPGEFTTQAVTVPVTPPWASFPVAGLFSGGYLKADVTLNIGNTGSDDTTPTTLPSLLNTTNGLFGICPYPHSGKGFNICAPGIAYGNTALFSAAADSFGKLRKIELWVDGTKVQEQDHTWDTHAYFDWAGTFSNGRHQAMFYAYDIDNTVQRHNFTFDVGGRH